VKRLLTLSALLLTLNAHAQLDNLFARALIKGAATDPLPQSMSTYPGLSEKLKPFSLKPTDLVVQAALVARMKSQPHCGRIAFWLSHLPTNQVFPDLGAEVNICLDSQPPKRQCEADARLIEAHALCANGALPKHTQDEREITAAALKRAESMNREQAKTWLTKLYAQQIAATQP
jgi:hypothetical protein